MNYKYIVIEGKNDYRCNSFEEIIKILIDKNYFELSENEKKKAIERKAKANFLFRANNNFLDYYLDNEYTYILSLLKAGIIYLLERKEGRELTKDVVLPDDEKNYVVVNSYVNELLEKYKN